MKILISGGSGFLGTAFSEALSQRYQNEGNAAHITWLTRDSSQAHPSYVNMMTYDELKQTDDTFEVILNLAGAGIADSRWSDARKAQLLASRVQPTESLLAFIDRSATKPKLFVSGSAIGWYGTQGDKPLTENSGFEDDFAHRLCQEWEMLALQATTYELPVAIVRTGVVIHPEGGMLGKLLLPFKLGLGGQLGDGTQVMSWISREDWVGAVLFIIEKHLAGQVNPKPDYTDNAARAYDTAEKESAASHSAASVYNLTAPHPITNHTFTKAVGAWLHRPTIFTLPSAFLKLVFGEMATLLIDGQKVLPQALLTAGYDFQHKTIQDALNAKR